MRNAQTVPLHGEEHWGHLGKCGVARPMVPGNHFRNTKFGYSSSKAGTMKGRSNWSGLL